MQNRFIALAYITWFGLASLNCAQKQDSSTEKKGELNQHQSGSTVAEVITVTQRPGKVPNFTWNDSTGKTVDFDSYRGKATLINFWATWCVPCKKELPDLVALHNTLASQGVKIIGISTDRGSGVVEDVQNFVREKGIPYQNIISNEDLEQAFGNIRAIPTSFLIDADGTIVQTFIGARSKEFFSQALTSIVR